MNDAIRNEHYGWMPCNACRWEEEEYLKPKQNVEFTTDSIRDQRREYKKDILAPFREGVFSNEYYQEYGTKGVEVTEKEIKNRKDVWKDISGWWQRDKSKGGKHK